MVERSKGRRRVSLAVSMLLVLVLLATGFGTWFHAGPATKVAHAAQASTPGTIPTPSVGTHVASADVPSCIVSDAKGNLWFSEEGTQAIAEINTAGILMATYPLPTSMLHCLVFGSDGNIWFTDSAGSVGQLNRTTGKATLFSTPTSGSFPYGIALGSDGNVWFTEAGASSIGRITPSGVINEFPTAAKRPSNIVAASDGSLWFTDESGQIGNLNPSTGTVNFYAPPTTNSYPYGITTDPADSHKIWFIEANADNLAVLDTTTSVITEYPLGSGRPSLLTFGPDTNIWFSYWGGIGNMIRATGIVNLFTTSSAYGVIGGTDGNVWFTQPGASSLANINPTTGTITEYPIGATPSVVLSVSINTTTCVNTLTFKLFNASADTIRIDHNGKQATQVTASTGLMTYNDKPGKNPGYVMYEVSAFAGGKFVALTRDFFIESSPCGNPAGIGQPSDPLPDSINDVFVLVGGIGSQLQNKDWPSDSQNGGSGYGYVSSFEDPGTVGGNLIWNGYRDSRFIVFSYNGVASGSDGAPSAYQCQNTFDKKRGQKTGFFAQEAQNLSAQIQAIVAGNPNARIHLLGHSQGGLVILTYLAAMEKGLAGIAKVPQIKDASMMDSPLGGIWYSNNWLTDGLSKVALNCSNGSTFDDYTEMSNLYASDTSAPSMQGSFASLIQTFLNAKDNTSNLAVVTALHTDLGIVLFSVGNENDYLYNPGGRTDPCLPLAPDFRSTQVFADGGDGSGFYGRQFTSGVADCGASLLNKLNHVAVLYDTDVMQAVLNVVEGKNPGLTPF